MAIDTETMQLIERIVARSLANATSLKGASDEIAKGVTQYVGARYVPLFAEPLEWDKTKAYEPLTIVLYKGNSYTSRQYVPVGVELTNESFWAETGNYNAQVEQYRQEVKSFDGRITANANAIVKETEDRAAAVTAEKTRAEGAEQTLQANIDAEKTRAEGAEDTIKLEYDRVYDSVASMKNDNNVKNGMKCKTLGYYTANDYGGGAYIITDTGEPNELDIISCSNNLRAKLVLQDSVNVNCLGAKGNGEKDEESRLKNNKAFERAFALSKSIVCMPNGKYWFNQNGAVNCRSVTESFTLNGNNSTLSDFSIELSLKDDSYDWRFAFNWTTGKFININFGADYNTVDSTPYKPCIVSGMFIDVQHVNMINKCVLLAYVNKPMDDLNVYDLRTIFGEVDLPDMNNHNLIESIDSNGKLSKHITNTGDGWSFNSVSEVKAKADSDANGELYGLVSTYAQASISFNDCIQIFVELGVNTCASFKDCHFESSVSGVRYINAVSAIYECCTFIDCFFYGSSIFPVDNYTTYIGCVFALQYGYNHTKSLFKTAKLIACRIEDTYSVSSSKDLTPIDMAGNYNSVWSFLNATLSYTQTAENFKNMGFTGDTSITAYIRLLDSEVYFKKLTATQSFSTPTNINLNLSNTGSCIVDLYVTNSGKVYHGQFIITDLSIGASVQMKKYSVHAKVTPRYDLHHKTSIYPQIDSTEIVDSIPEYTERNTAFLIAPNLFVDTESTDAVKGYVRIDKSQLTQGAF